MTMRQNAYRLMFALGIAIGVGCALIPGGVPAICWVSAGFNLGAWVACEMWHKAVA